MGAVSELYAMRRSFSGDAVRGIQSRSGDSQSESGAPLFDFVASVQSAEADIIESEERAERQESKRQFVRLLRLYFKKILSDQERKFLTECLRSEKTPHKIGRAMGLDYRTVIESVQRKHEANAPRLAALMRAVGYDCRRGLEFLPSLRRYMRKINYAARYAREHVEEIVAYNRAKRASDKDYAACCRQSARNYYNSHRDEINARRRAIQGEQREKNRARCKAYDDAHKDEKRERMRVWRAAHRDELLQKKRAYYAAHRDEINARKRAKKTIRS